jgi:hypothetical protein
VNELSIIRDVDRDSIQILPLSIIPLQSEGLRRVRMVKNSELASVIEIFHGKGGVSGQVAIADLPQNFPDIVVADKRMLQSLAKLTSYDIYCLRVTLRKLGIAVNEDEYLKLSDAKQGELQDYMKNFTQRLIVEVFGSDDTEVKEFKDVLNLYQSPDRDRARAKLALLADSLEIEIDQVPAFLEDYGDVYMSIAYYRECLDSVQPAIADFAGTIDNILRHNHLKEDRSLVKMCTRLKKKVETLNETANKRFTVFEEYTNKMWEDIDADRFREFKAIVIENHTALGAILCTLSVKMSSWIEKFPQTHTGGLVKRAEFIRLSMQRGF